jgi:hypothetical protein
MAAKPLILYLQEDLVPLAAAPLLQKHKARSVTVHNKPTVFKTKHTFGRYGTLAVPSALKICIKLLITAWC